MTHSSTFKRTFNNAFIISPCCNNNKVSNENVENVVKAPKKPIPTSVRYKTTSIEPCSIRPYNTPIINEPEILTINVAKGKPFPRKLKTICIIKNRKQAPEAPPIAINRYICKVLIRFSPCIAI